MDKYLERSLASKCKGNLIVFDAFTKADSVINNPKYDKIICSVSGGADSDVMTDIIHTVDVENKVTYVWFNTGLEYQATKDHLDYLESRYYIKINRERAIKPIPLCCKEYGQPFMSKMVSSMINTLQKHDFKFEDKSYEELIEEYPKISGCIKWWCNKYHYDDSVYNINYNRWLKEFIIANPPKFKISSLCCKYAKKDVSHKLITDTNCDLIITGIRKNEIGIRSAVYSNCYTVNESGADSYRPLFWMTDTDRRFYEKGFNIKHSDCYEKWGFKRTGCVGCPYNSFVFENLRIASKYEPWLITACNKVFKESYDYTKQYKEFKRDMDDKEKGLRKLF